MNGARQIFTVFLAFLWLAVSSHVLLESAQLIHDSSHHEHATDHGGANPGDKAGHDAADGRCVVSDAQVTVFVPVFECTTLFDVFWCSRLGVEVRQEVALTGLPPPDADRPPLASWQFLRRTALSPRVPSFIS